VFEVLKKLNQEQHLTIVVVEQKVNILMEYVGRLLILKNGALVADKSPREIVNQPNLLESIGLSAPPVSQLADRLKTAGLYTQELPLTVDEA
ncbi:MAG TPA: energy-coupling factor ABC transporter ATP-binding protein, partial [Firmicutes bacterium]|nr:energy-coupling factor ABC transporter ATP-binding protein [Bacillota bacterium]